MDRLEQIFRERFKISSAHDVLFITGSGALALEACVYSSRMTLCTWHPGKFSDQLNGYMVRHGKWSKSGIPCSVHYETSISRLNDATTAKPFIMDCVSSFPFYTPPDCGMWVTVSGKQLGAPAGLGIVVLNHEWQAYLYERSESYLDIWSYQKAGALFQTPHTPAIYVFEQLLHALETIDYDAQAARINKRWQLLCEAFGVPHYWQSPPVYTFPHKVPAHDKLELYGSERTQLFLYSGTDAEFETVFNALRDD